MQIHVHLQKHKPCGQCKTLKSTLLFCTGRIIDILMNVCNSLINIYPYKYQYVFWTTHTHTHTHTHTMLWHLGKQTLDRVFCHGVFVFHTSAFPAALCLCWVCASHKISYRIIWCTSVLQRSLLQDLRSVNITTDHTVT